MHRLQYNRRVWLVQPEEKKTGHWDANKRKLFPLFVRIGLISCRRRARTELLHAILTSVVAPCVLACHRLYIHLFSLSRLERGPSWLMTPTPSHSQHSEFIQFSIYLDPPLPNHLYKINIYFKKIKLFLFIVYFIYLFKKINFCFIWQ